MYVHQINTRPKNTSRMQFSHFDQIDACFGCVFCVCVSVCSAGMCQPAHYNWNESRFFRVFMWAHRHHFLRSSVILWPDSLDHKIGLDSVLEPNRNKKKIFMIVVWG